MQLKKSREGFLDGLRFIAAIAVLFFHYAFRGHAEGGYLTLSFPELSPAAQYGFLGVQLFFMISGYVITWSIEGRTVRYFAAHRLIRLYPTFWCCALFTFLIERATHLFYPGLRASLVNITMVPGWFGFADIDGVYWSLATELQFYILVGLSVAIVGFKRLADVFLVWLVVSSVLFYLSGLTIICSFYYPFFCVGGACYFIHRDGYRPKIVALLVGSLGIAVWVTAKEALTLETYYHRLFKPIICAEIVLAAASLVYFSSWISARMGRRASMAAIALGGMTYPLYLIHQNVGYTIMDTFFTQSSRWLALILTTALMLAAASAIYVWFDRPVRAKLRKIANNKLAIDQVHDPRVV
jgi:peptidoglycan/LPS O-acetylase OafA/YrhL